MSHLPCDKSFKRIGLVDYRLDNFHASAFVKAIRELRDGRGYEIAGAFAIEPVPSVAWADQNEVEYVERLEALCAQADFLMILAPSNPECHLHLCSQVFPFGKPTYVDKPFAPDLATARTIFDLADQYGVAVQTSSALRYTKVQSAFGEARDRVRDLTIWAGGMPFQEYGIHPVELAVSCMGHGVSRLAVLGSKEHPVIVLEYGNQTATIHFNAESHAPFRVTLSTDSTTELIAVDDSMLFHDLAAAILDFFDVGTAQIDRAESLKIRQILDMVESSSAIGRVVPLQPDREPAQVPAPRGIGRMGRSVMDSAS